MKNSELQNTNMQGYGAVAQQNKQDEKRFDIKIEKNKTPAVSLKHWILPIVPHPDCKTP